MSGRILTLWSLKLYTFCLCRIVVDTRYCYIPVSRGDGIDYLCLNFILLNKKKKNENEITIKKYIVIIYDKFVDFKYFYTYTH